MDRPHMDLPGRQNELVERVADANPRTVVVLQSGGPVNDIISTLIGRPFALAWLSSPGTALVAVMIADIWQWTPLMFLILLAGLVGVPEDQMRAATLLGASWWQRFRTIVMPKMKTIIIIALSIRVIENFKIFDTLYIMTGGGPVRSTETVGYFMYRESMTQFKLGYGAAATVILLAAVLVISIPAIVQRTAGAR